MPAKVLDGRYKLIKKIGAGGFGHTFIARDMRRPGSPPCVVKQLKPASDDPTFIREARRLFNTEAETLEKLGRHDQIPQLLAYFEEDTQFFLVQEFIEGRSLHDELKMALPEAPNADLEPRDGDSFNLESELANIDQPLKDKQLPELEVIKILKDVLEVLEFVHSEGVIHRDIKPDNLIRRKKDQKMVLIDFGAVRAMQDANTQLAADEKGESRFTVTIGTPGYMPSEQCAGRPHYSSDIYALGMVAIKALTGRSPTDLPSDPATGELVWRDQARVSNGLAMVLTRMVRYHYTQRYQSVREVNQGLNTFAIMTDVERQATTSKIVRSSASAPVSQSRSDSTQLDGSARRRTVATAPSTNSNAGVIFLFGGLLAAIAVIAAFAIPAMQNKPPAIIVNNQPSINPISASPIAEAPSPSPSTQPIPSEPTAQTLNLAANQDLVISKTMFSNAGHTYTFSAKTGQTLVTAISGDGLSITVLNSQGIALPNAVNVLNTNVPITSDGTYTVQLRGTSKNPQVPYELRLGLKDPAIANPIVNPVPNPPPIATTPPSQVSPTPTQAAPPQIEIKIRKR